MRPMKIGRIGVAARLVAEVVDCEAADCGVNLVDFMGSK
tara:strand:- start:413 stop:529 length:117 start_codon:yes stop_codon:yes gene_type:complete